MNHDSPGVEIFPFLYNVSTQLGLPQVQYKYGCMLAIYSLENADAVMVAWCKQCIVNNVLFMQVYGVLQGCVNRSVLQVHPLRCHISETVDPVALSSSS